MPTWKVAQVMKRKGVEMKREITCTSGRFEICIALTDDGRDYYERCREGNDLWMSDVAKKAFVYFRDNPKATHIRIKDGDGWEWRCVRHTYSLDFIRFG